jgi:hypothetical protein
VVHDPNMTTTTPVHPALPIPGDDPKDHDPYCAYPWHSLPCTCGLSPVDPAPPAPAPDGHPPPNGGDADSERIQPAAIDMHDELVRRAHDILNNGEIDVDIAIRAHDYSAVRAIVDDVREDLDMLIVELDQL